MAFGSSGEANDMSKSPTIFPRGSALLGLIGCGALLASYFDPLRAFSTDPPTT